MKSMLIATLRAGIRARAIHAVLAVALVLVVIAYLASMFSPRQPQTVALDVGLSGLRFSLVLFALFWCEQLLNRDIAGRGILFILAYPLPRTRYLFARYLGIVLLLGLAAALIGLLVWIVVFLSGAHYDQGFGLSLGQAYWATVFGLLCDAMVVAAFSTMLCTLSTVPMLPMAVGLAFAIGGKSLGAVLDYFARGADGDDSLMQMSPLLDTVQWVLPDLSRLDWRVWPMYGVAPSGPAVAWSMLMAIGYAGLMLAIASRSFSRREFG